jgi:RND superfamily putative drug exporter
VLAVSSLALGASGVSFIEVFGICLALAIVMDATVIRGLPVPAFMRIAGGANGWAPSPLGRLHNRFGLYDLAVRGHPDVTPIWASN